jgi:hypothetical protein
LTHKMAISTRFKPTMASPFAKGRPRITYIQAGATDEVCTSYLLPMVIAAFARRLPWQHALLIESIRESNPRGAASDLDCDGHNLEDEDTFGTPKQ